MTLRSADGSLAEIAGACGFSSQSHVTKVLTLKVGTSPGLWRRERTGGLGGLAAGGQGAAGPSP